MDPLREKYQRERARREDHLLRDPTCCANDSKERVGEDEALACAEEILQDEDYTKKDQNFRVRNGITIRLGEKQQAMNRSEQHF